MIVTTNITRPVEGNVPSFALGARLAGAIDVEWSKNYRIKGGNVPFCYSVVWLALPGNGRNISAEAARFWYRSAYVEHTNETGSLVDDAAVTLTQLAGHATLVAGHQLSSDLAVLAAAAPRQAVTAARMAWQERHNRGNGHPRILDTRYDSDRILGVPVAAAG